jgi:hypothetical protein
MTPEFLQGLAPDAIEALRTAKERIQSTPNDMTRIGRAVIRSLLYLLLRRVLGLPRSDDRAAAEAELGSPFCDTRLRSCAGW